REDKDRNQEKNRDYQEDCRFSCSFSLLCVLCASVVSSSTSSQLGPADRSTLSGTSRRSARATGSVISSRTRAATASNSSGGTSNTSSSWICRSIRDRRPSRRKRRWPFSIASLIRSAAEPCTSLLIASRSGWLRLWYVESRRTPSLRRRRPSIVPTHWVR